MIAGDGDRRDLVLHPGVHVVLHRDAVCSLTQQLHRVLHVEVALLLHVVANVERALVQQIVVDRALLVHRDQQLLARLRHLGPIDHNLDLRALLRIEIEIQ